MPEAHPSVSGGADLATLTPAVPAAQIDLLDGRRYVRFVANLSCPSAPLPPASATLPSLDRIIIRFNAPVNCVLHNGQRLICRATNRNGAFRAIV